VRVNSGIFLIAAGAIIAFAVRDSSGPIDFTVVGIVIMLAGVAGLWLSYRTVNREQQTPEIVDPAVKEQYRTDPYPVQPKIDVTPTGLADNKPKPHPHRQQPPGTEP
jgi:hypothetical protein